MPDKIETKGLYSADITSIRANLIGLVGKMFGSPVELGTDFCKDYLKVNSRCNDCISFTGCSLTLTVLNWLSQNGDYYTKDKLQSYIKGLFDGYTLGVTGIPETLPEDE